MDIAVYEKIKHLAFEYSQKLDNKITKRVLDMENDDKSHHLIYNVLGINEIEGSQIDIYQNKGRFLYKYAGSFLEEATIICMKHKYDNAKKIKIDNTIGVRPKTFEIDCLVNNLAHEIKWRDATTDGDHVMKEHTRIKVVKNAGYTPVRVMFYYPNRTQSKKVQEALETLYKGIGGEYYCQDDAWNYIKKFTDVDLYEILTKIAKEREV